LVHSASRLNDISIVVIKRGVTNSRSGPCATRVRDSTDVIVRVCGVRACGAHGLAHAPTHDETADGCYTRATTLCIQDYALAGRSSRRVPRMSLNGRKSARRGTFPWPIMMGRCTHIIAELMSIACPGCIRRRRPEKAVPLTSATVIKMGKFPLRISNRHTRCGPAERTKATGWSESRKSLKKKMSLKLKTLQSRGWSA